MIFLPLCWLGDAWKEEEIVVSVSLSARAIVLISGIFMRHLGVCSQRVIKAKQLTHASPAEFVIKLLSLTFSPDLTFKLHITFYCSTGLNKSNITQIKGLDFEISFVFLDGTIELDRLHAE